MTPKKKKDWTPETFPEPRTIPSAWDGNALMAKSVRSVDEEGTGWVNENEGVADWTPEKFPKPRTYPKNWSIDD